MVTTKPTTVAERNDLRTALAHATARPWDTVRMSDDNTAVMAGHQHEGFVADCLYPPTAAAIALAVNLAERLLADLENAHAALRAWETWEAGIVMDPACWGGSVPVLTQPHLDALTPAVQLRNRALYGQPVKP